jgi:hypothetical protein
MPETDIKPYFGSYVEDAVEQFTPAFFRRGVHCDYMTIDQAGTVRGKVVADYGQTQEIPGIPNGLGGWLREPQTWVIWEASVVVRWKSYFANAIATDFVVDVGAIHGIVNTEALRNSVLGVIRSKSAEIGEHRPQADAPAVFFIFNEFTGKAMDMAIVQGNPNGADVRGWQYNGQTNQQWVFEQVVEGQYRLRNVYSEKYLDNAIIQDNPNGSDVYIWQANNQGNQVWFYESSGDQRFRLRNSLTGKYLDMAIVQSNPDGANIYGWTSNGQSNQTWRLVRVPA